MQAQGVLMAECAPRAVGEALEAAVAHLLARQRPQGYWWGRLASNVCMEAEYIFLAHCLQRRDPRREERIGAHLLARQQADGGWNLYPGGPLDLNATVEAYQALKLLGLGADHPVLQAARARILERGGVPATRVFTRVWLALLGQYPWEDLPLLPPEMMFLPPWFPLNIYDFASWARATVVPMALLMAHRPVFPLPPEAGVPELFPGGTQRRGGGGHPAPQGGWAAFFRLVDRLLHLYQALPWHPGRAAAERRALAWILAHQEADGSWGGIQPPWFYSLLALQALGLADHPALERGWAGLEAFGVSEPDGRWWLQACVSPVWDTALAVLALRAAGLAPEHPALVRAGQWLLSRQVWEGGDWQVRRPRGQPGGWPFEHVNRWYPDVDDTAIVLLALSRLRLPDRAGQRRAMAAGFRWLLTMQSRGGGWGAFDAESTRTLCARIPFADFGAAIDPPTEDVTGHCLECLGGFGYDEALPAVRRAVAYLQRAQRPDGSWWGRWGVNHIYGTGAVLPGLAAVGVDMGQAWVRRAADWLVAHQNPDGGWGESCASYEDPQWIGRGDSTAAQTAWALLGLLCTRGPGDAAVRRGVGYLMASQRGDGGWGDALYTGTGFPRDFYIGYELYAEIFPVLALGRFRRLAGGEAR